MPPKRSLLRVVFVLLVFASVQTGHGQMKSVPRSPLPLFRNQSQYRTQNYVPPREYRSWPGYVAPNASQPLLRPTQQQASYHQAPYRQAAYQQPAHQRPVYQQAAYQQAAYQQTRGPQLLPPNQAPPLARMSQFSLIHQQTAELALHDIVTIIVDEKSEVQMNQKFNRQRNSKLLAEIGEFVRIGEDGRLLNAAANAPTIDAKLQSNLNSTGQFTDSEGIRYRIAARIVDIRQNGNVILEAKKVIRTQDDTSEYSLTGELRAQDIGPDNTASSENIANLRIVKGQRGRIYDSTKRNWGYRLYDMLFPF